MSGLDEELGPRKKGWVRGSSKKTGKEEEAAVMEMRKTEVTRKFWKETMAPE